MNILFILTKFIEKDPGIITEPISNVLGVIINAVFSIIYNFTASNSLGLSIIIFTIIVRFLLLPLNYKQQKSMYMMRKIQPEMKKIQDKYKGNKDPQVAKKMQLEMSKLYQKHNYNPLSGCLPLLVQLPILFALFSIMKTPYVYVTDIKNIYTEIGTQILNTPNFAEVLRPIVVPLVPHNMTIDIGQIDDLLKAINKFSPSDWDTITTALPSLDISELLIKKSEIDHFLTLNLTEIVGYKFPNILLALLSGATTFLSSYLLSRKNKSADPTMQMQSKIMNIVMPIILTFFTLSVPCGLAIYWISGNLIQCVQQVILSNYCEKKFADYKV